MITFILVNIISFLFAVLLYYLFYYKKYCNKFIIPNLLNINEFIYIDDNNKKYRYKINILQ